MHSANPHSVSQCFDCKLHSVLAGRRYGEHHVLTTCSINIKQKDLIMKSKSTKQSPGDRDERRKPGGTERPVRRTTKVPPAEKPGRNPYKQQPVRPAAATAAVVRGPQSGGERGTKHGAADEREALFNSGAVGTFREVMVQRHEVTMIRGILIEIDGECLRVGNVIEAMPADGFELYERHVRGWLENHPLLSRAEVRFSGRWLHCILYFGTPVEIKSDRRRELWHTVIKAVQRSLPSDPEAPSLLAMTRPVGSVSSKTGRTVELIKKGEPVTELELLQFAEDLTRRGFATVTQILFGTTTVSPCPVCCKADSTLHAAAPLYRTKDPNITSRGSCYDCGKVTLTELVDLVLKGREEDAGEDAADADVEASTSSDDVDDHDCPFHVPADGQGDE